MSNELYVKIILAIISILGAIISGVLIPFLKSKITEIKLNRVYDFISFAVRCAEQKYSKEQWAEKKNFVMDWVISFINKNLGINLTYDDLDVIVEGIVNEIKYPNGKQSEVFKNQ